ncbi:YNL095C and ECM3 (YOR092W) [Zygosaccharomyces parabailii]|nr:YNL095C and ECM3 (YOR092W) [Zygosaccharomyces parabailii]
MTVPLRDIIWTCFKPMIKIYLIIGTGFGLARLDILTVEATRAISNIILTLLLPCLAFYHIVASIEDNDIKDVAIVCLSAVLIFGTGLFMAFVVSKTMPVPPQWRKGILAGGMFGNISDLPIAYIQTLDGGLVFTAEEGDKGVANVIIFLAMFLFCLFNMGGFRLIEADFKYQDQESGTSAADEYEPTKQLTIPDENSSSEISGKENQNLEDEELSQPPKSARTRESIQNQGEGNEPSSSQSTPVSLLSNQSTYSSGYEEAHRVKSQPLPYTETHRTNSVSTRPASVNASIFSRDTGEETHNITPLIREYSNVDQYGHRKSNAEESVEGHGSSHTSRRSSVERVASSNLTRMLTSDAAVSKQDIEDSGKSFLPEWLLKLPPTKFVIFFLTNCLRPCSVAVIVGLTIAFIPWVKALFVTTSHTPYIPSAPDRQPPLSFFMDYTSYVGAASVPFGLLLLGGTLGRLKINKLYPGFWKSAVLLVAIRLCIMPIFGVLWCNRLVRAGWLHYEEDKMLLFVIVMDWGLPSMTTIIYFTASYTPEDAKETVQMDCVSFFLMIQYPILAVSLPFLASFYIKVKLKA